MSIDVEILRSSIIFEGLPDAQLFELAAQMQVRVLHEAEWVAPAKDSDRSLGVVLSGSIEVFATRTGATSNAVLDVINCGGSFGAWTLLGGGHRSGELRAAASGPTTFAELDGRTFDVLAATHAELQPTFIRNAVTELRQIEVTQAVKRGWGITDPNTLSALRQTGILREISAGEVLIRKGDPASTAFLVVSGTFCAIKSGSMDGSRPDQETERRHASTLFGAGSLIGERALIDGGTRHATIVAVRSARVVEFEAQEFKRICRVHPEVLLSTMGEFIRRNDERPRHEGATAHRIALVGDGKVDVGALAKEIALAFPHPHVLIDAAQVGPAIGLVDAINADDALLNEERLATWLDRRAPHSTWQLLVADPRDRRWTAAVLTRADHIVAVVEKRDSIPKLHPVWEHESPRTQATTLLLVHPPSTEMPTDTAVVLQHLRADAHLHVRPDRPEDIARVARTLANVPYGLVLSGGGARGFAHLGAVKAMRELGIPCDMVGGTSIGAVMAVYQGFNMSVEEQLSQTEVGFKRLMDYTLPVVSVLKGKRTSERIQRHVGTHTIEDLWIPYFCVSTNLSTNDMKIHERGPLATAIRASLALPGIFPPVHDGEHFLVDGGVLNNLPLDVMRDRNPFGRIIAVDVAANMALEASGKFGLELSGWRAAAAKLRGKPLAPSITSTIARTSVIGSARDRDRYRRLQYADLHMELTLKNCDLLDFGGVRSVAEFGYQAALPQLAAWSAQYNEERCRPGKSESYPAASNSGKADLVISPAVGTSPG